MIPQNDLNTILVSSVYRICHHDTTVLGLKIQHITSLQNKLIQILIGKNIKNMTCNGICHRYKITKGNRNDSWYKQGAKRCTTCDIYIKWEGLWCPCCGYMLRTKPKNNQYKQRYNKNV